MLRPTPLLARTSLAALALLASGLLIRADDPPASKPPPGFKTIYQNIGGKKVPIFVQGQEDPLSHAQSLGDDPLDPQRAFSETNPASSKTFIPDSDTGFEKPDLNTQKTFSTKVYDTTTPDNVYKFDSKSTFHTTAYDGVKAAPGTSQTYATKNAPSDLDQADSAFAPIGSSEQNRTAPINAKAENAYAAPGMEKAFAGPEAEALHRHLKPGTPIDGDFQVLDQIPDRPLSVGEVKNLLNHDFKADFSAPPQASKAMDDPSYQPEPLRIEPTSADDAMPMPSSGAHKPDDDDNDPVPSPGTMAEPLPSK